MNAINFIDPIPPQQQREVIRWFNGSMLSFLLIGTSISYLHYRQAQRLNRAHTIHTEQTHYFERLEKLRTKTATLQTKLKKLKKQLATVEQLQKRPENPLSYLTTLNNATEQNISINAFSYVDDTLTISGNATSAQEVTHFIKRLGTSERFSKLKLVSLHPHTDKKRVAFCLKRR